MQVSGLVDRQVGMWTGWKIGDVKLDVCKKYDFSRTKKMLRVGGAASEAFLTRQLGEEEEAADGGGNAVNDSAAVNWHL